MFKITNCSKPFTSTIFEKIFGVLSHFENCLYHMIGLDERVVTTNLRPKVSGNN